MKTLLTILMMIGGIFAYAQAIIGMSPVVISTPANAQTPSSTADYNTNITLAVSVKNYGNTPFSGTIDVFAKRDTLNGVLCDSTSVIQVLNPNDSINITLGFFPLPGPNGFKTAGNGNTIVVWPIIVTGTGIEGDSVRPVIWLNPSTGINSLNEVEMMIYPNPVDNDLFFTNNQKDPITEINIYNSLGLLMLSFKHESTINLSTLTSGVYYVNIIKGEKKLTKKIIKK